jgi:hypothetical protein
VKTEGLRRLGCLELLALLGSKGEGVSPLSMYNLSLIIPVSPDE